MRRNFAVGCILAAAWATSAQAQLFGLPAAPQVNSGDVAWVAAGALVGLLAAFGGLQLHSGRPFGGRVVTALSAVVLAWAAIGYSLALGPGNGFIGNLSRPFLSGRAEIAADTSLPESVVVLFELVLALVAAALLAAATGVDRPRHPILFFAAWLVIAYVPLCHWIRGGGWLASLGVLDFAGALVVHLAGGVAALILSGRNSSTSAPEAEPHPDRPGAALLLLGSAALAGAAGYAADDLAGTALLNVALAIAAGALATGTLDGLRGRDGTTAAPLTGAVAAAVAISASAGYVGPAGAVVTGALGALAAYAGRRALLRRNMAEPGAGIFALHGISAIVGTLLLGLFAFPELGGPGFAEPVSLPSQLAAQAIGLVVTVLWSAGATAALLWLLSLRRARKRRS